MIRTFPAALLALCIAAPAAAAPQIRDADTKAWWSITGQLSSDAMEGRDTGSPGHARAAALVADRFRAAGLKPAGDGGGFLQSVPLHEVRVDKAEFTVLRDGGGEVALAFLHQVTVRPTDALKPGQAIEAPLAFRGYCSKAEATELKGRIAICFGTRRHGLPSAAERLKAVGDAGAVGLINVDDPGFTIEPSRWPEAYARSVTIRGSEPPAFPDLPVIRLSAEALAAVIEGSGRSAPEILAAGAAKQPLPSFDIPARLRLTLGLSQRDYASDNVLALLPGTDPRLGPETVVVSAHLDGYGFGEPVDGDSLYNGAFDDAAYVATLIRLAEQRRGKGFRRSVLFAAFTGEEKGLLGARWFTAHPAVPKADLAADINLDQLRPLFPLKILTMHAVDDTTLGETARQVAGGMGIEIRPDEEPERNLGQRSDDWPFLQIGVPATAFIFGFDPGTEAERRYREWYRVRYHRPQDDMTQPIDFQAAADFNSFFYRLAGTVADADARPEFKPDSPLKPKP